MKKITNTLIYAFCVTIILSACGKTPVENPFDGTDNHITSFSLTADGITYVASIAQEKITITIPVNADLTGAKVQYKLCEHTAISPNPSSISAWNDEQIFRVKSYDGKSRDYIYTVVRSEISHTGNVVLLTQADVDAFAQTGTTVIEGNLIIGSAGTPDPETAIINLDGLSLVKEVKYQIILNSSFSGADLAGLDNVERCGGFYIGSSTSKIGFPRQVSVALPSLVTTGDMILNCDSIQSTAFTGLESVGSLYLSSKIVATAEFTSLKEVANDLSVKNAPSSTNTTLEELIFQELTFVGGSVSMHYFSSLSTVKFPKLRYVGSGIDLTLNSTALEELNFPELETASGVINIERAPNLLKIALPKVKKITSFIFNQTSYGNYPLEILDLSSLESITTNFYIRSTPMETLVLPRLKSVGGNMSIWDLKAMTKLEIPELTQIGGKIQIMSANSLSNLDLSKVTELGAVELTGCLSLNKIQSPKAIGSIIINCASNADCPIPEFEGLEHITKEMSFTSCGNTTTFNIKNVKKIEHFKLSDGKANSTLNLIDAEEINTFEIGSYNLIELNAPKLAKVIDLKFNNIWSLTTISIPLLKKVDTFNLTEHGSWNSANAKMTNLDAFAGIKSIGQVKIEYCAKLIDFSGLSAASANMTEETWSVKNCAYNPTYKDMLDGNHTKP